MGFLVDRNFSFLFWWIETFLFSNWNLRLYSSTVSFIFLFFNVMKVGDEAFRISFNIPCTHEGSRLIVVVFVEKQGGFIALKVKALPLKKYLFYCWLSSLMFIYIAG